MSDWKFYANMSPAERMELNNDYWEQEYARSKIVNPVIPRRTKQCPVCNWLGNTTMVLCPRDKERLTILENEVQA